MVRKTLVIAAVLMAVAGLAGAAGAQQDPEPKPADPPQTPAVPEETPKDTEESKVEYVLMETSSGDIYLELNREKAPITVENFMSYVEDEFYDGTIFHRVIPGFMIQGGGFEEGMAKKETKAPIKNEWKNGLKNERGTISMARLGGQPDSASSQFFINHVNNAALDAPQRDGAAYAVFGKVIAGMDVVNDIAQVETGTTAGHQNVPVEAVMIEKVRKVSEADAKKAMDEAKDGAKK